MKNKNPKLVVHFREVQVRLERFLVSIPDVHYQVQTA